MKFISMMILLFLGVFTGTAVAASVSAPSPDDTYAILRAVVDAFAHGQKVYAGMLALSAGVVLVKKLAPKWKKADDFVHTDVGGSLLTLVGSFAVTMVATLSTGQEPSWSMAKTAALIAVGAAGGYSLIKRLLVDPVLRPFAKKCPAWTQPMWALVFYIFDRKSPIQQAEEAGNDAVAKTPSKGLANSDEIKDVE